MTDEHRPQATAAVTRERLLTAARKLFAERGFAGTSTRLIAREAGVNLGGIQYHFGSKEELFRQTMLAAFKPGLDRIVAAASGEAPVRTRLENTVRVVYEQLWDNPDQAVFMVTYRLYHVERLMEMAEVLAPVTAALVSLVEEGQEQGVIREGPSLLFVMSLMSQPVYFMLITRRTPPEFFPLDPSTPAGRQGYVDHMVEFVLRGLAPGKATAADAADRS